MKLIVIDIQKGITDERLYDFDGFINNVTISSILRGRMVLSLFMFSTTMGREPDFLSVTRISRLPNRWRQ